MQDQTPTPLADPFFDALDTIGSPIFVVERIGGDEFRIVHLNRYFQIVADLDPDEMTSGPVREIFPRRVADSMSRNYAEVLSGPDTVRRDESYRFGSQTRLWRTTLSRAPTSPAGRERVIGVAVPIDDLNERVVALASEVAELRVAIEETRTLAGLCAHDLRAPLANVQSLTEIVLDGFADLGDGKSEMIRICGEVAGTALQGIDALMARVRTDLPARGPRDDIDLAELCRGVVVLADPAGRLDISYPAARLACDATVLGLGIRNVIDNAARFARGRIDVTLRLESGPGDLVLSIADDGPGLAAGLDPIARALAGRPRADGRGYGLGAVASLLKSRGGELRIAAPRFGTGANFEIVLPGTIVETVPLSRAG